MEVKPVALGIPQTWLQNTHVSIAIFVLCIVAMMVIPLPPLLVDVLIISNFIVSLIIILGVLYIKRAIDLSTFPSILLVTTVYRLSLWIGTCRLILGGEGDKLNLPKAFGGIIVGGGYLIGIIVFLILCIIQLLVIVRGTTRISEVAARFTLDSMPGKQMAIDADLNAGLITEEEAARRRLEIRREADFYGSMDGACRYVQGDVIATFIIAVICIIGGSLMGIIVRGEPIIDALKMYTTYTIGGALSVQIPALLISIATGLLVSRAAVEHDLGRDIVRQLGTQPWAVFFGAAVLCILTLFTPLPKWLLLSVAAFLFFLGYLTSQRTRLHLQEERKKKEEEEKEKLRRPESILPLLHVDPIELEIGYNLIPLAQPERGGDLLERVTLLRRQIALDLGIIVPQIRIRDNIQLEKNTYVIKLRGTEMARNRVYSDKYLALVTPKVNKDVEIKGEVTTEPIFGVQALWVEEGERQKAEKAGYTLFDPSSVIATHLTETIKRNAPIVLGRQETQSLLDNLRQKAPTVVSELVPQLLTLGEFQKVLHNLLRENISIRDLLTICETLADWAPRTRNTEFLTEKVRSSLAHQISRQFATDNNTIEVITLDPTLEDKLVSSIKEREGEEVLVLAPEEQIKFISLIQQTLVQVRKPVPLLTSPRLRRLIRHLTQMTIPDLAVISYAEVVPQLKVVSLGRVKEK